MVSPSAQRECTERRCLKFPRLSHVYQVRRSPPALPKRHLIHQEMLPRRASDAFWGSRAAPGCQRGVISTPARTCVSTTIFAHPSSIRTSRIIVCGQGTPIASIAWPAVYKMALSRTSPDVLAVLFVASGYLIWRIYKFLAFTLRSPLRIWPGPQTPSWLYGNLREMLAVEGAALPDKLFERYGKVYVDREFFMVRVQSMEWIYACSSIDVSRYTTDTTSVDTGYGGLELYHDARIRLRKTRGEPQGTLQHPRDRYV